MNGNNNNNKKALTAAEKKRYLTIALIAVLVIAAIFIYTRSKNESAVAENGGNVELNEITGDAASSASAESSVTADTESGDAGYTVETFDISKVPDFANKPYVAINNNVPFFTDADYTTEPFETYSKLDSKGRCGVAYANICREIMPTSKRGDIYMVKPTGWQHVEYDFIDGFSLYNRCHLIAHSLAGEDANDKNLITGTRYMNNEGMNPFENMVADYVRETNNHVLYRVTPIFEGKNLIASGVLMEGYSVEDRGEGICFNVYCYNVQPGVEINYANGKSRVTIGGEPNNGEEVKLYILNTKTKKFHLEGCENISAISDSYRGEFRGTRSDLIGIGYVPCGGCNP